MNILITGAFGTLGSEFVKQLLDRGDTVTGIDNNEWAVASYPDRDGLTKVLGDFDTIWGPYDLLIHCAAYKHVDLIENNRLAGSENNVEKTRRLYNHIAAPILFISTDKAVEPSSYYGATKQEGEALTKNFNGVIARMGNIMGSSGSVIPKWERAIVDNVPLTITDWGMTRYMQPVDNLVEKILALYPHAKPGEVIIPEMGPPLSLKDVVYSVLDRHSLPHDYPTVSVGMRPGEKLHEKLLWDWETAVYTDTNGIIVTENDGI